MDGYRVALLAEGVGRNRNLHELQYKHPVALLAEGVGRNVTLTYDEESLPRGPTTPGGGGVNSGSTEK